MKKALKRWLPSLAWMGLIYVVSAQPSLPQAPEPLLDLIIKKGGHALAYAVLAWLYLWGLRGKDTATIKHRLLGLAMAVAYAISDEFHQSFIPGRNPSLVDVLIDTSGAMLTVFLAR